MLNRVIFGGKVYYKVKDLAELFDISLYKMKKAIEEQNIETRTLEGFGRTKFVLEKNVSVIEVNGEVTIIKTNIQPDTIEKKAVAVPNAPIKKESVKKASVKSNKKNRKVVKFTPKLPKTELEKEHKALIKKGTAIYLKFHKAQKESIAHAIIEKHLGKGADFKKAPVEKAEQVRLIFEELKAAVTKITI